MNGREFKERLSRRAKKAGISVPHRSRRQPLGLLPASGQVEREDQSDRPRPQDPTPEGIDRLLIEPLRRGAVRPRRQVAHRYRVWRRVAGASSGAGTRWRALVMIEVKTRKSVFLREAARELGLQDARVVTARHESLLADPSFHEAFDVLSVRAVRVETRVFAALQAFLRPGGKCFISEAQLRRSRSFHHRSSWRARIHSERLRRVSSSSSRRPSALFHVEQSGQLTSDSSDVPRGTSGIVIDLRR